jgi:predicted secreted protein
MWNKEELQADLREGIYTIVFEKVNGEERTMKCTLHSDYLPPLLTEGDEVPTTKKENPNVIAVWDMEKDGWRSMRVDSIKTVLREEEDGAST